MKKIKIILKLLSIAIALVSTSVYAGATQSQLHVYTGMVSASFSGPQSGSISVPMSLGYEYEMIKNSKQSFVLENIVAIDAADSKTKYNAVHLGQRYYLFSSNYSNQKTEEFNAFKIKPKYRFFVGWNFGLAQVVVLSFSDVLDAVGTVVEYGGHAGALYQINDKWALEAKMNLYMGYGISSISVTSMSYHLLLGGAYYY